MWSDLIDPMRDVRPSQGVPPQGVPPQGVPKHLAHRESVKHISTHYKKSSIYTGAHMDMFENYICIFWGYL